MNACVPSHPALARHTSFVINNYTVPSPHLRLHSALPAVKGEHVQILRGGAQKISRVVAAKALEVQTLKLAPLVQGANRIVTSSQQPWALTATVTGSANCCQPVDFYFGKFHTPVYHEAGSRRSGVRGIDASSIVSGGTRGCGGAGCYLRSRLESEQHPLAFLGCQAKRQG